MKVKELDLSQITQILETPQEPVYNDRGRTNVTPQRGPLRFHDAKFTCSSRGCSSPTYIKVNGIARCMMHALIDLNNIIVGNDSLTNESEEIGQL